MEQNDMEISFDILFENTNPIKKVENVKSCDIAQQIINQGYNIPEEATNIYLRNRDKQKIGESKSYFIIESHAYQRSDCYSVTLTRIS
jgi:hypothetical protein